MTVSEKESTSLSANIFEDLDIIVTKEASCNTDSSDGFTTDRKQKRSSNDSALVIALKEHIDSLKQQLRDKQFIIESLLANLQHNSYNTSHSNGNQNLVKKREDNIDLLCPEEVDDLFESIKEITESIENSKEGFQTDKRTIGNNTSGKTIVNTNINGYSTNKISKENQSCDNSRASLQDQTKQIQSSIKLGNNHPNATSRKDDTPEQTNKVIILGDSIIKHVRGYDLSHSLENCKVHVKNIPGARVKCMQDCIKPSIRENPHQHHLIIHVGTNDISTNQRSEQIAKSIAELALSEKATLVM